MPIIPATTGWTVSHHRSTSASRCDAGLPRMQPGEGRKHSVARKLLRDLSCVPLNGQEVLRRLQAGSLMGCLTHLSLAGCSSVQDDPTWGSQPLLTSQYAAVLLANPHLEYVDISRTRLSNHGVFYFLLELSLCDPVLNPSGLKHLKQLLIGPPVESTLHGQSDEQNCEVYAPSLSEALTELYFQSPALQLVALLLPANGQHVEHRNGPLATHTAMRQSWRKLNEDNRSEVRACVTQTPPHPGVLLRTRRGQEVLVEQHDQTVAFSKTRLSNDWISCEKAKLYSALDYDRVSDLAAHAVPDASDILSGKGWGQQFASSGLLQQTHHRDTRPAERTSCMTGSATVKGRQGSLSGSGARKQAPNVHHEVNRQEYGHVTGVQKTARCVPPSQRKATFNSGPRKPGKARSQHKRFQRVVPQAMCLRRRLCKTSKTCTHQIKRHAFGLSTMPVQGASRTVDALLDDFVMLYYTPHVSGRVTRQGVAQLQNDAGHEQLQRKPEGSAARSADSQSFQQDGYHSDPGAHPYRNRGPSGTGELEQSRSHANSDDESSLWLPARPELQVGSTLLARPNDRLAEGRTKSAGTVGQLRPRRRLLPLWNSPPRLEHNSGHADAIKASSGPQQEPVYITCSDSCAQTPDSVAGLSVQCSSPGHAGILDESGQACMQSPAVVPADGIATSQLRKMPRTAETPVKADANESRSERLGADQHVQDASERPCSAQRLQDIVSEDGSCPCEQQEAHLLRLSGAHRRRLRRQQEDEWMQMNDPQGWFRLQQTMQALMPYGWDKYDIPFCI
eukprot:jgi/Ulvmu1/10606/UM065_0062.1